MSTASNGSTISGIILDGGGAVINVLHPDFGVPAAGSDATQAFSLAEAAAHTAGLPLYVPAGTYLLNQLPVRVPVITTPGTTLKSVAAPRGQYGVLRIAGDDVTITGGGTIDGAGVTRGISASGVLTNRPRVIGMRVVNSLAGGIAFYGAIDPLVQNCRIAGVSMVEQGAAGDGIFFGECIRPKALYNTVYDFVRIGIVVDTSDGAFSRDPLIQGNHVEYGHDSSAGESNGGVWVEMTQGSITIRDNTFKNLRNNPAPQTSVAMISIRANGNGEVFTAHCENNTVLDALDFGYVISAPKAHVTIIGGAVLGNYKSGIVMSDALSLVARDTYFAPNQTFAAFSHAVVFLAPTNVTMDRVVLDGLRFRGNTSTAGGADVHVWETHGPRVRRLTVRDLHDGTIKNTGEVPNYTADSSSLTAV